MHLAQEALLEFHKKMGQTIGDPRSPNVQRDRELREKLIKEELQELLDALEADDTVEVADALADLVYVLAGSAVTWGIDLASVFEEVHRSNMTKKRENKRADGKVLKDADFSPPDIKAVLKDAAENFDSSEDGWWEEPTPVRREAYTPCGRCGRKPSKSAGCLDGSCNKGPVFEVPIPEHEPPKGALDNIMVAAKIQARYLGAKKAMKDLAKTGADLVPDTRSNGLTEDGGPYTINDKAFAEYEEISQETSDGIPQAIKGEFTTYGAYVFSCPCGRRHAAQNKLGSRGGLSSKAKCECMCGNAFEVDFTTKEPTVRVTTIEEMRKANA